MSFTTGNIFYKLYTCISNCVQRSFCVFQSLCRPLLILSWNLGFFMYGAQYGVTQLCFINFDAFSRFSDWVSVSHPVFFSLSFCWMKRRLLWTSLIVGDGSAPICFKLANQEMTNYTSLIQKNLNFFQAVFFLCQVFFRKFLFVTFTTKYRQVFVTFTAKYASKVTLKDLIPLAFARKSDSNPSLLEWYLGFFIKILSRVCVIRKWDPILHVSVHLVDEQRKHFFRTVLT